MQGLGPSEDRLVGSRPKVRGVDVVRRHLEAGQLAPAPGLRAGTVDLEDQDRLERFQIIGRELLRVAVAAHCEERVGIGDIQAQERSELRERDAPIHGRCLAGQVH